MLVEQQTQRQVAPAISQCAICGPGEYRHLFDVDRSALVACGHCGLVYTLRRDGALSDRYDETYFNSGEHKGGYQGYAALSKSNRATFRERIAAAERRLGRVGTVLDVGCAYGDFMHVARERGWRAIGLDISRHAATVAWQDRQIPVWVGNMAEIPVPDHSIDLVTVYDVIEHLADPIGGLREARRVLKPNGLIHLTTPDVASLSAQLLGSKWYHYKTLEHVYFFSPRTLRTALERAGLKVLEVRPNDSAMTLHDILVRLRYYSRGGADALLWFLTRLRVEDTCIRLHVGEMEAWAR